MKTSVKIGLIVTALVLLACLAVFMWQPDEPEAVGVPDPSQGPSFEVTVEKPRLSRPLFGLLPARIEEGLSGGDPRFDHTSPGAEVVSAGDDRLELRADGWDLHIETDGEGRIAAGTRLVFPIQFGERRVTFRCRPADGASGYLRTTMREGTDVLDGEFQLELATCENFESGKVADWPPAPLTVRGRFAGLPRGRTR